MKLSELKEREEGVIVKIDGNGNFIKRITEMGFVRGKVVRVVKNAPLKDPIEYEIMGYDVSLRRKEASMIEVVSMEEAQLMEMPEYAGVTTIESAKNTSFNKDKNINVVLIGNPNSGKTSLFNYISGLNEHTGNYAGVTINSKIASVRFRDYNINITDLPGTYSLTAYSPDEKFVRDYIANNNPDVVINVIDASNIERNLYLTTQLIDMEVNMIVALNMYDELLSSGDKFDHRAMGRLLGIPFIPTIAKKGKGIPHLLEAIVEKYKSAGNEDRVRINYGQYIEGWLSELEQDISKINRFHFSDRFVSIKLAEGDPAFINLIDNKELTYKSDAIRKKIENEYGENSEIVFADARYGFISGAMKETFVAGKKRYKQSNAIDSVVTHKVWGFPIFIAIMWAIFFFTFTIGQYPVDLIEYCVSWLQGIISSSMSDGAFKDLIINGIIGGLGSVVVFLPNIMLLFLFISLLEDSGYMSRAAFIMDKLMHRIGLHGKSFIPLIMGFGCNVPAIMASRIIENKYNRIQTILITPFMSCSARLPVYLLIVGAFFPENAGNILFLIYLAGIIVAVISAIIFKKLLFKAKDQPFVMELPPYRIPTLRSSTKHMWMKGSQYLQKMGGIILVAVAVIWFLGYYPHETNSTKNFDLQKETILSIYGGKPSIEAITKRDSLLKEIDIQKHTDQYSNSYLGRIGKGIEPIFTPLGFDWKLSVGLMSGIAAKEIIVSTLGVINQIEGADPNDVKKLEHRLKESKYTQGKREGEYVFNKAVALSFIIFVLIYFPCIAVVTATKRETGEWKWALFTVVYTTILAWLLSFIVYNAAKYFML